MHDTRSFDMSIEIAVPPDAVWQALTDAEHLVAWFATDAAITPKQGGDWVISWDGRWPWRTEIQIFEPHRHLRLLDRQGRPYDAEGRAADESVAPMPIAIDWYLEGKAGGTTSLRLVHSGFGRGGSWDDEYEGVRVGWQLELNGLKHYLERHRGQPRRAIWNRTVTAAPLDAVLPALIGPHGILPAAGLRAGDRYEARLPSGDRIAGRVVIVIPGRAVQVTIDAWNDALYRLWVDRVGGQSAVNSWLSAYGMDDALAARFEAAMRTEIERITAAVVA